jgi:hypothetical protein
MAMKVHLSRNWKWVAWFAMAGFLVMMVWAGYQHLTHNDLPRSPTVVDLIFIGLCPESLLSIFLIDMNVGSFDFYSTYFLLALWNAFLYGNIAAALVGLRQIYRSEFYTSGRLGTGSRVASAK